MRASTRIRHLMVLASVVVLAIINSHGVDTSIGIYTDIATSSPSAAGSP